ncbi:MAG: hypothetical protein R2845_07880 [Thermomicrobiales bacterium]
MRYLVETFEQNEQLARGYNIVYTPHIASEKIYKASGHLETYRRTCTPRCRSRKSITT